MPATSRSALPPAAGHVTTVSSLTLLSLRTLSTCWPSIESLTQSPKASIEKPRRSFLPAENESRRSLTFTLPYAGATRIRFKGLPGFQALSLIVADTPSNE